MRKVLHILLGIYGFIANLITYITGIDNVLNILNKYYPLCIRTEKSDVTAIAYYASTNV